MEIRKTRLFEEPTLLNLSNIKTLPWSNMEVKEFNEKYAYKPMTLYGQFDHTLEVKVARVKEGKIYFLPFQGEAGFQIITPFYCYTNENGESCPLLVDRGWIHFDIGKETRHRSSHVGPCMIRGLLFKGNSDNKYR